MDTYQVYERDIVYKKDITSNALPSAAIRTKLLSARRRIGCQTCRLLRVKCDENKPKCSRCIRLRRICTYNDPDQRHNPYAITRQLSIKLAPVGIKIIDYEVNTFRNFYTQITGKISGSFNQQFWKVDVPKAAHQHPSIWHATIALSMSYDVACAKKRKYMKGLPGFPDDTHYGRYSLALEQYNKSVAYLLEIPPTQEAPMTYMQKEMIIVTVVLYIGICSMLNIPELKNHRKSLMNLLEHWRFGDEVDASSRKGLTHFDDLLSIVLAIDGNSDSDSTDDNKCEWNQWTVKVPAYDEFTSTTQAYIAMLPFIYQKLYRRFTRGLFSWVTTYQHLLALYKKGLDTYEDNHEVSTPDDVESIRILHLILKILTIKATTMIPMIPMTSMTSMDGPSLVGTEMPVVTILEDIIETLHQKKQDEKLHESSPALVHFSPKLCCVPSIILDTYKSVGIRRTALHLMGKWPSNNAGQQSHDSLTLFRAAFAFELDGPRRTVIPPKSTQDKHDTCECISMYFVCTQHRVNAVVILNSTMGRLVALRCLYESRNNLPYTFYKIDRIQSGGTPEPLSGNNTEKLQEIINKTARDPGIEIGSRIEGDEVYLSELFSRARARENLDLVDNKYLDTLKFAVEDDVRRSIVKPPPSIEIGDVDTKMDDDEEILMQSTENDNFTSQNSDSVISNDDTQDSDLESEESLSTIREASFEPVDISKTLSTSKRRFFLVHFLLAFARKQQLGVTGFSFKPKLTTTVVPTHGDSTTDHASSPQSSTTKVSSSFSTATTLPKRGRVTGNDDDDDSDDNGNNKKGNKKRKKEDKSSIQANTKVESELLLACHFCKWKPLAYTGCQRHVLRAVHRVKQHLRRHHLIPIYCGSCNMTFKTTQELHTHSRQRPPCEVKEPLTWEGVTKEQEELLRRRANANKSEVEQWYDIFRMLFPDHPLPESPYINPLQTEQLLKLHDFTSEQWPEIFNALSANHLPPVFRGHEDSMRSFVDFIFQNAVNIIFSRFETGVTTTQTVTENIDSASTVTIGSASPDQITQQSNTEITETEIWGQHINSGTLGLPMDFVGSPMKLPWLSEEEFTESFPSLHSQEAFERQIASPSDEDYYSCLANLTQTGP